MTINSCEKGKRAERWFARYAQERGFDEAKRGQQHRGGNDSPDIVGVPGWHVECKWIESYRPHDWMAQAVRDSAGKLPVVFWKRNRRLPVAILRVCDFAAVLGAVHAAEHLVTIELDHFLQIVKAKQDASASS